MNRDCERMSPPTPTDFKIRQRLNIPPLSGRLLTLGRRIPGPEHLRNHRELPRYAGLPKQVGWSRLRHFLIHNNPR